MTLSQKIFRVMVVALVALYLASLFKFLEPTSFLVEFNVRADVVIISTVVAAYVFFFLRRSQ